MPKSTTKRARNAQGMNNNEAAAAGLNNADARDPNAKLRPARVSLNSSLNLEVPGYPFDHDNFYYHWFAEHPKKGGRINAAEGAYYEKCVFSDGSNVVRNSGDGTMYLFRLPIEFRKQDLREKTANANAAIQKTTMVDHASGEYAPTRRGREGGDTMVVEDKQNDNPFAA